MSLSSLIVQREVATMRQVEEALARQVIYGGDLVTNLLEVARVDEAVLTGLLAESMRLSPAPAGELPAAPEEVRSLVPREVALERTVVPLAIEGDGKLVLVVAEPLPADLVEQLRFALGMTLEQRAAPAVRVQQAVAKAYGVPLERRMLRLIARLSGEAMGNSLPPMAETPAPATVVVNAPPSSPRVAGAQVVGRLSQKASAHSKTSPGFPAVRGPVDGIPLPPAITAPARAAQPTLPDIAPAAVDQSPAEPPSPQASAQASAQAQASSSASAPAQVASQSASASSAPPRASSSWSVAPSAGAADGRLIQRDITPGPRPGRRRRGPITAEAAKADAEEAADRDALLDLFFDFSQQFFDYSALFLVHADIAEGRDAFGSGATRERVLGIGVPLDLPSILSTAREKRLPVVSKAAPDSLDAVLLTDLHRPRDAEMAIVPLVVRTRAVAILIGDCGDAGIDREAVKQVVAFSGTVGKAFERIIVRRKLDGFIAGGAGGRESAAGRVSSSMVPSKPSRELAAEGGAASSGLVSSPSAAPAAASSGEFTGSLNDPFASSEPPLSRPVAPPVPFIPRRPSSRAPSTSGALPPPAANVAAVRKIAGPPIPREEPEAHGPAHAAIHVSVRPITPSTPPVAPWPDVGDAELEVKGTEEGDPRAIFDELGWTDSPEGTETPPLGSNAIAVAPHRPPAPVARAVELPSVIVEDLDRELVAMVDRLASGEVDEVAEGELLRQGQRAMRAIMSRFPGPVAFSRARIATANSPPRASECGPILRLVARERRVALPFVLDRLMAADAEERGWATHLVCELPYIEAIPRLLPRLRDPDASTAVSAAHALASIARSAPEPVRDALIHLARAATPEDRMAAVRAMAKLREPSFVPELVHALGDDDDGVVTAAHDALVQVTRQDLGTDARPWLRWWEQNSGKHRIEWLIDALAHDIVEIRRSAAEELRALTKEYFGYAGDLPPRDRDRAQQRYRDWWLMEGRSRFRRA
jgi:hypothetical protein